jgi:hypothetical protein
MEFSKEDMKKGNQLASYNARHFTRPDLFEAEVLYNIEKRCEGLPHCPTQLLKGPNKAAAGSFASKELKRMEAEGKIKMVPGPTGVLNYVAAVNKED